MRNWIALVLLLLPLSVQAAQPAQWIQVRSSHFVVLTDSDERQARHIAGQFEQMRAVFHALLPAAAADDIDAPITVLAVKDKRDFQALVPQAYIGKGRLELAGYFQESNGRSSILLRLDAQGENPYATVYHEYTHYMVRHAAAWLPLWLNEGLAEYYQNTEIDSKEALIGKPSADDIAYLREHPLLPLPVLLQVDRNSPYYHEEQKGTAFYAESWALTHYLLLNDRNHKTQHVQEYARLTMQHQDPVAAAQTAFGDLNKLERALDGYVRQSAFGVLKMKTTSAVNEKELPAIRIATYQADAVRASMMASVGRTQEAEALLDTVLHEDQGNTLARETMGMLRFRQGDIAGARREFGEAVHRNSDSYLVHYYYAVLPASSGEPLAPSEIESNLLAAIHLNPAFAPPYDALATFYATHQEKLDQAHGLNLQAVELDPENLTYRLNTAWVLEQNRQFVSALSVLHEAARLAKTPQDAEKARVRIDQIEKYQAALERGQAVHAVASNAPAGSAAAAPAVLVPVSLNKFKYPVGSPTGPHHRIQGVIHGVQCLYPSVITLHLDSAGRSVFLYNNDLFHVPYMATNFTPQGELHPCTGLEGMKARIEYGEVDDKTVGGQIVSIDLSE